MCSYPVKWLQAGWSEETPKKCFSSSVSPRCRIRDPTQGLLSLLSLKLRTIARCLIFCSLEQALRIRLTPPLSSCILTRGPLASLTSELHEVLPSLTPEGQHTGLYKMKDFIGRREQKQGSYSRGKGRLVVARSLSF